MGVKKVDHDRSYIVVDFFSWIMWFFVIWLIYTFSCMGWEYLGPRWQNEYFQRLSKIAETLEGYWNKAQEE